MIFSMKKILVSFSLVFLLFSCKEEVKDKPKVEGNKVVVKIDFKALEAVPNPIEIASLMKDIGIAYDQNYINHVDNISKYDTDFKKALNLGIYSTDLGYANIYDQSQESINCITAIRELSTGLKIDSYFDFDNVKKAIDQRDNPQELLKVTLTNLQKINEGLDEEDRGDVTLFIITGGWIEALHLSCTAAKAKGKKELLDKIADQKIALKQLIDILDKNKDKNTHLAQLRTDLDEIVAAYAAVNIESVEKNKPAPTKQEGDIVVIDQKEIETKVNFTQEDLNKIIAAVDKMRAKIIG